MIIKTTKGDRQALNAKLSFVLWNELKDIWCSWKLYFHLVLSFSTTSHNWRYRYCNTFNGSVVCIGLFISLCGSYQALVFLIIACSWSIIWKRRYLIHSMFFWSKRWGSLGERFRRWFIYGLKKGNHLQFFLITHKYFKNIIFWLNFHHFKVHRVHVWLIQSFSWLICEIICGKVLAIEVDKARYRETPFKILKSLTTTYHFYFIIIFSWIFSSFQGQQSWYLIH